MSALGRNQTVHGERRPVRTDAERRDDEAGWSYLLLVVLIGIGLAFCVVLGGGW